MTRHASPAAPWIGAVTHDGRLIHPGELRVWDGPGVLVVFLGVATAGSRSHDVFPAWADGWDYFVAGWGAALTAIAGRPLTAGLLAALAAAAAPFRP